MLSHPKTQLLLPCPFTKNSVIITFLLQTNKNATSSPVAAEESSDYDFFLRKFCADRVLLNHVLETDALLAHRLTARQAKHYELSLRTQTHVKHTQTLPYNSIALNSKEMSSNNTAYYTYNASKSFTRTLKSNWGKITFMPGPSRPHRIPQETLKGGSMMPDLQLPEAFFFLGILPQSVWSHWVSQRHNSLISVRATLMFLGNVDISLLYASGWKNPNNSLFIIFFALFQ